MQQDVVEGLATVFGSLYEHLQVLDDLLLSAEIVESQRAQCVLELFLARRQLLFSDVKILVHHIVLQEVFDSLFQVLDVLGTTYDIVAAVDEEEVGNALYIIVCETR